MSTSNDIKSIIQIDTDGIDHGEEELDLEEQQQQLSFDLSEVNDTIRVASEGAITEKTVNTYRRYHHFDNSSRCYAYGFIVFGGHLNALFMVSSESLRVK